MGIEEKIVKLDHNENKKHIDQELSNARAIYKDAYTSIKNVMATIKNGRKPDFSTIEPAIESIIGSLTQNKDALASVCLSKEKDDYIYKHATSTAILSARFSQHLGFSDDEVKNVAMGAMLGDIGKIFIPSKILYKPGKLTDKEFVIIKKHASYSSKYLEKYGKFDDVTHRAAVEHHERVDGTGYPHGLTGDKISMAGQITAIADTYDAMTSVRLHQCRKEPTQTLKYMLSKRGELFEEGLVKKFVQCLGIYPVGTLVALNNGFIGVVLEHNVENVMQPVVRLVYDLKKKRTIRPFMDIDIMTSANDSGLKVISDIPKEKFSFHPLSAIG